MKIIAAAPLLFLLGSCQTYDDAASWGELQQWGTLRETLRDGQTEARVNVADVARDGVYGVGALEGLRGEITIVDGEVWISEGATPPTTRHARGLAAPATVLFSADVKEWEAIPVEAAVDPSVLDAFVAEQARTAGIDTSEPFPFLVEGELDHLRLHVIAGECPIRARMLGEKMERPAYELHAEAVVGRLIGIYAPDSSGVVCHMGSQSHVHALLEGEEALTGHVESAGIAAGSVLRLPKQ